MCIEFDLAMSEMQDLLLSDIVDYARILELLSIMRKLYYFNKSKQGELL